MAQLLLPPRQEQATKILLMVLMSGTFSVPRFADINGDNKADLVVGAYNGDLKLYQNDSTQGAITFTSKTGTEQPL